MGHSSPSISAIRAINAARVRNGVGEGDGLVQCKGTSFGINFCTLRTVPKLADLNGMSPTGHVQRVTNWVNCITNYQIFQPSMSVRSAIRTRRDRAGWLNGRR